VAVRQPRVRDDAQIVNAALQRAFEKAELKPPRYVGSHILRHSLATNMVRRGASLGEIGDVLRHRARRSTMIYAWVDGEGLRTVAREWPMAGGDWPKSLSAMLRYAAALDSNSSKRREFSSGLPLLPTPKARITSLPICSSAGRRGSVMPGPAHGRNDSQSFGSLPSG